MFLQNISRDKILYNNDYYLSDCRTEDKQDYDNILDLIQPLLEKLSPKLKEIAEAIYIDGSTHKEVAESLGIKHENVRKYKYKIVQKLREITPLEYKEQLF